MFSPEVLLHFCSHLDTVVYLSVSLIVSLCFHLSSTGVIEIGDPVSTMNSFSIPFNFTNVVEYFFLSVFLLILSILFILVSDSSDSPPITSDSSSVTLRTLRL